MTREEKEDVIDKLCDAAGCHDEARGRHRRLFLDGWNVHPPKEFREWVMERWEREEKQDREYCVANNKNWKPTEKPNAITLWNSQKERDEWTQIKEGIL